jgi:RNA polymerase sigma-70 factor (ECF subfamily)
MRATPDLAVVSLAPSHAFDFTEIDSPHEPRQYVVEEESQLIDQAVAGDRVAARLIYDTHVAAVFRLAARIVGPEFADECTQDAFVRAFQRLGSFRRQASLKTWLHSITVSVALNLKRREKRASRQVSFDAVPDLSSRVPDSDPLLERKINQAIDALGDELRSVVVLHLIEGRSHPEIGEMLGIPEGTSKARLSRARTILREKLANVA